MLAFDAPRATYATIYHHPLAHPCGTGARHFPFFDEHTHLWQSAIRFTASHTVENSIRLPECVEIDTDPGIEFEFAGPRNRVPGLRR